MQDRSPLTRQNLLATHGRTIQKFHDTHRDVGDGVIEVWQDRFVLAADPGGVEYDAGQTDALMAARFKKRSAEAAQGLRGPGARGSVLVGLR